MRKIALIVGLLLLFAGMVQAQDDWVESNSGDVEYNCEMLTVILDAIDESDTEAAAEFLVEDFIRIDGNEMEGETFMAIRTTELLLDGDEVTVETIFADAIDTCDADEESDDDEDETVSSDGDTFNVEVVGNVNLRSCAGTDCDIVGQAADGSVLTVFSEEDDWYEVEFEGETAYIASWLTERGPDVYVDDLSEVYVDERTGCRLVTSERRGDMEIQFILSGDERNEIFVDLYRPNDTAPLDVEAQLSKTFTDTGEPYIQQYYHWGLYWYTGVHEIELTYDGETSIIAWNVDEQADILVYISCDQ